MRNVSGIKKVAKIFGKTEIVIYDKPNEREQNVILEEERVYVIPAYQREIRWEPGNVQMLIDDLKDGSKFLGTITLSTSEPQSFDVIDGQQRMTVITLLITYLNTVVPENKRSGELCKIDNKSFPLFNQMLDYHFNYDTVQSENKPLFDKLERTDSLSQREHIRKIWNCITERVEALSESEKTSLLTALLESDLNVIVNEIDGTDTQRKFCVDYFIDINNKSVVLDSLDIIRAYAFKEDFATMTEKWTDLQEGCNGLKGVVKYSRDSLYFQYFICMVNREVEYKLSRLAEDYTTKEEIDVRGKRYASGTHVWTMFSNDRFYSNLLSDLNDYINFIKLVISTENGGNDEFKNYFITAEGGLVDETRIWNTHTIINSILRNDDIVPKMMVMKYYLEILKPKKTPKNRYRIISMINFIANVFTMGKKRKGSEIISNKIIQERWEDAIRDYANRCASDIPTEINFAKISLSNKIYTVESGQHMAQRYLGMMDSYKIERGTVSVNQNAFKNANCTSGERNIEHFAVNRQYTYAIYQDDGNIVEVEINAPRKIKKYIATMANYLILNSTVNTQLRNRPVYEKIEMLETRIKLDGIDQVIPSDRSRLHYYLYKQILHDDSVYPKARIAASVSKTNKKSILRNYYQVDFEKEFLKLANALARKESLEAARLKYDLLSEGYANDGNTFYLDSDSEFSNVEAEVDLVNGKLIMSAELTNPAFGEENDGYSELIDWTAEALANTFKQIPELRSSNEWGGSEDESIYFYFTFEPSMNNVNLFVDGLALLFDEYRSTVND